jgi:radical SAM protein with 4Fe4S-binding SPASM domain
MIQFPVESQLTEYLHSKAARAGIPLSGTFELTPCCNMACKMCYVRMTKQQQEQVAPLRTAGEWLALAEEAKKQGLVYLLLTGGEPFLRPDFREILSGLNKMGLFVSINSNGTLIDEEVISWLKQTPPTRVNVTLYGASDATYERLCGNPNGFTQAVRGIRLLKAAGIVVKINCSITPYNVDDLDGIFAFAKQEGLLVQASSYMFPPLRRDTAMVGKNDRLTAEEAAYQSARIISLLNGDDYFLQQMENRATLSLSGDSVEDCPELPAEGECIRCRAGKCSFWVTWDGRILPCGMFPGDDAENVFETKFTDAWGRIKEAVATIRMPPKCSKCQMRDQCKACAAMALTETGRFDQVPEYRCQMMHAFDDAGKLLEHQILETRRR